MCVPSMYQHLWGKKLVHFSIFLVRNLSLPINLSSTGGFTFIDPSLAGTSQVISLSNWVQDLVLSF